MGGALLQQVNRDTQRFAYKCSAIRQNGITLDVQKLPKTDPSKASKGGILGLMSDGKTYWTARRADISAHQDLLVTVFQNGALFNETNLENIRTRAKR